MLRISAIALAMFLVAALASAQDSVSGAIHGAVEDQTGARVSGARVAIVDSSRGFHRDTLTNFDGAFLFVLLVPGEYRITANAAGMAPAAHTLRVELGETVELTLHLRVASAAESVSVAGEGGAVETQPSDLAGVISEQEIDDLPINGRRFTDLVLLTPGVTQDPRSLTSATNGDLAFGGLRGWQTSYLVDGADNNNSFFAQARGRYRAPYQFSNEVVQQFRVSSNTYGAELGRSGGAHGIDVFVADNVAHQ